MGIQNSVVRKQIEAQVREELSHETERLEEALEQVNRMLAAEDRGWKLLTGQSMPESGPALDDLKKHSAQFREMAVGGTLGKRGLRIRHSYVWPKNPHVPGLKEAQEKRAGRPGAKDRFFRSQVNQENVWGDLAHEKMEFALGTDGGYLLLGDNSTKELRPVPLNQIEQVMTHPDFDGEIWAYLRSWTRRENNKDTPQQAWYYVDTYTGDIPDSVEYKGQRIPVDKTKTMIDIWANRQSGWALGVPDLTASVPWIRVYTEMVMNGKTMTEALATFVAQVRVKSQKGSDNVGVRLAQNRGAGKIATVGEGNQLDVFQSAGKTYDFNGIRPIAALVATGLEISVVHLLSDPGAAGSSYGSASNLDLPTKRAMISRQNLWASYLERVVKWGTDEDVEVTFPRAEDADLYRQMQVVNLGHISGLFHEDEIRPKMAEIADLELTHASAPEGYLLPNNANSLARKDIDLEGSGSSTTQSPGSGSGDQGQSNGTGGADSSISNDERTDTLTSSEMMKVMSNDRLADLLEQALPYLSQLGQMQNS